MPTGCLYLFLLTLSLCWMSQGFAQSNEPQLLLPKSRLEPRELAVVVNLRDEQSIRIGRYYLEKRHIPSENLIEVSFNNNQPTLGAGEFKKLYQRVSEKLPAHIQAFALAWSQPYKAGCMSITSAFATGYDTRYCAVKSCAPTQLNPYFNSFSHTPYEDHDLRPAMLLAAKDFEDAKALIDRGVASDGSFPKGTAYLISTSDKHRNARAPGYQSAVDYLDRAIKLRLIHTDALLDKDDVLFYFTGLSKVKGIDTNNYLPGAIADHLTSSGGVLFGGSQMSILNWIEAGATGSYGTVVEPCNYQQKFPVPGLVIQNYLAGDTLIEAYWKSVAWPGEGLFIGEPLAAPFSGDHIVSTPKGVELTTQSLFPGRYRIMGSQSVVGPYAYIGKIIPNRPGMQTFSIPSHGYPYLRLDPQ